MTVTEPASRLSELAREAWKTCLGQDTIEPLSDFFDLGGDSLQALQLIGRLTKDLGADVPLRLLFDHSSFDEFVAALARRERPDEPDAPAAPRAPAVDAGSSPCSITQNQRLRVLPDGSIVCHAFNPYVLHRIRGPFRIDVFRRAVEALVRRQEALRIRVTAAGDGFVQTAVADTAVDFATLSPDGGLPAGLDALTEVVRKPFDVRSEVVRVAVAEIAPDDHLALLCCSHAICDGWSLGVAVRELSVFYEAIARGSDPRLPPLPLSWREWVIRQHAWVDGPAGGEALAYWRGKLAGSSPIPETRHPEELPVPTTQLRGAAGSVRAGFPAEDVDALEHVARDHRATLYMVLLTLLKTVVLEMTGRSDVAIVTPFANRLSPAWQDIVGWLSFSVPFRTELAGAGSFPERLARVRETVLEAQDHAIPYPRLVDELAPELIASPLRRPTVMLAIEDERALQYELPLATSELVTLPEGESWAHPGLYWFCSRRREGMELELRYEADALPRAAAEHLVARFSEELAACVQSARGRPRATERR